MKQSFKGFLMRYCAELAGERTSSLRRLCALAGSDAPRVAEPLFLLALEQGQLGYLLKLADGTWMSETYRSLAGHAYRYRSAQRFLENEPVPVRYAAVLDAFHVRDDDRRSDRRIVGLLLSKTQSALQASGVTRYRACKDLGLNKGNFYAYLAGDTDKVSRETAQRIFDYASELQAGRIPPADGATRSLT